MRNTVRRFALAMVMAVVAVLSSAASSPRELTFDQLLKEIESYQKPIVIDIYADWCGPCKRFAPIYDEAAEKCGPVADFYRMDIDANPQLSEMLGIRSIPTLLVLYVADGKLRCEKNSGFMTMEELKDFLRRALSGVDGSELKL